MAIDPDVQDQLDGVYARLGELEGAPEGVVTVEPGEDVQPAMDSNPYIVRLAPGLHRWDESVFFPTSGRVPSLIGYGPIATQVRWETDGGTALIGSNAGNQQVKGIYFRAGSGKPDCWYDNSADSAQDWGEWVEECFFADWNTETGTAAIKLGNTVNAHLSKLRFGGGRGPAIWAPNQHGGLGSLALDRFTVDSSAADDVFGGLLRFDWKSGSQKAVIEVTNGRIESSGRDYAAPYGIVHIDSPEGPSPVMVHTRSLDIDLGSPIVNPHAVVAVTGSSSVSGNFTLMNVKTSSNPTKIVPVSNVKGTPTINEQDRWGNILLYAHGS